MQRCIYTGISPQDPDSICIYVLGHEDEPRMSLWRYGCRHAAIIHFVLRGRGYFNGHPVTGGQGFYIPANTPADYFPDAEDPWSYVWIDCSPEFGTRFAEPALRPDEHNVFRCTCIEKVEQLRNLIMDGAPIMTQTEAMYQTFSLLRLHEPQTPAGIKQESHVRRAKQYIDTHLTQRITVADVANAVFLNPRYLSALFAKYERMTPKEYILIQKLRTACDLLVSTNLSIKEIAQTMGFSDIYIFSKTFKAKIGQSPSEYRAGNR